MSTKAIPYLFLVLVLSSFSVPTFGQTVIDWNDLSDVALVMKDEATNADDYMDVVYPENVLKLDGQTITINGYLIPMDLKSEVYILSAKPEKSCFFCGKSGPETAMKVEISGDDKKLKMDKRYTFTGTFMLGHNPFELFYTLEAAKLQP